MRDKRDSIVAGVSRRALFTGAIQRESSNDPRHALLLRTDECLDPPAVHPDTTKENASLSLAILRAGQFISRWFVIQPLGLMGAAFIAMNTTAQLQAPEVQVFTRLEQRISEAYRGAQPGTINKEIIFITDAPLGEQHSYVAQRAIPVDKVIQDAVMDFRVAYVLSVLGPLGMHIWMLRARKRYLEEARDETREV